MVAAFSETTRAEIETFVTDWMEREGVPGASVALVDADGPTMAAGFGARDLDTNDPVTPETLMGVGSVTKSVTALAVMRLVEAGELSVEDRVAEYVPHYQDTDVTVRDLLTHSSGMPSDGSAVVLIARLAGIDPVEVPMSGSTDFERHVRAAAPERMTDKERFFYYNSGYTVLGEIIEALTGEDFPDHVTDTVLAPLGMTRSTFDRETFQADPNTMTAYHRATGETTESAFPFDDLIYAPGGLLSSVAELSTYLRLQMGEGATDGTRLLSAERTRESHTPVTTRRTSLDGTEQEYAYGWMVSDFLDDTLVGHGGSITVSTCYVGFLKESGVGVAVLSETQPAAHPMVLGPALLALTQGVDPAEAVPHFGLARKADAVTGEYRSYRGVMDATVEDRGGSLELTLSTPVGDQSVPLFPETTDPTDYRYYTVDGLGDRVRAEFISREGPSGDGFDLLFERWRLHPS
jgi:CubicO group peptidase (beta-lactamase class C family)